MVSLFSSPDINSRLDWDPARLRDINSVVLKSFLCSFRFILKVSGELTFSQVTGFLQAAPRFLYFTAHIWPSQAFQGLLQRNILTLWRWLIYVIDIELLSKVATIAASYQAKHSRGSNPTLQSMENPLYEPNGNGVQHFLVFSISSCFLFSLSNLSIYLLW